MGRFRQHPRVRVELEEAVRWYEDRARLGADLLDDFDDAVTSIVEGPRTWSVWLDAPGRIEIRRRFLSRFPYYVPYVLSRHDEVFVLAFAHARRRPSFWLERLPGPRRGRRGGSGSRER